MSLSELFAVLRLNSQQEPDHGSATYGEMTVYDPETHMAKFLLPLHRDDKDNPIETGWIPIETPFHGSQYPPPHPKEGAAGPLARIIFQDGRGLVPISAKWLYNETEDTAPYPKGDTWGTRDPYGNEIKSTQDGWVLSSTSGFNVVASEQGKKITIVTPNGLEISVSDSAGTISLGGDGLDLSQFGLMRITDVKQLMQSFCTELKAWANANFQSGTNAAPAPSVPSVTGSAKVGSA